jgi:hypothetical protein
LNKLAKSKYHAVVADKWDCSSFAASLRIIYNETIEADRLLKDAAIKAGSAHTAERLGHGDFTGFCRENGEIGLDVLEASQTTKLPSSPLLFKRCPWHNTSCCVITNSKNKFGLYRCTNMNTLFS